MEDLRNRFVRGLIKQETREYAKADRSRGWQGLNLSKAIVSIDVSAIPFTSPEEARKRLPHIGEKLEQRLELILCQTFDESDSVFVCGGRAILTILYAASLQREEDEEAVGEVTLMQGATTLCEEFENCDSAIEIIRRRLGTLKRMDLVEPRLLGGKKYWQLTTAGRNHVWDLRAKDIITMDMVHKVPFLVEKYAKPKARGKVPSGEKTESRESSKSNWSSKLKRKRTVETNTSKAPDNEKGENVKYHKSNRSVLGQNNDDVIILDSPPAAETEKMMTPDAHVESDDVDLTFQALVKRIKNNLDQDEREEVMGNVNGVVEKHIRDARERRRSEAASKAPSAILPSASLELS